MYTVFIQVIILSLYIILDSINNGFAEDFISSIKYKKKLYLEMLNAK